MPARSWCHTSGAASSMPGTTIQITRVTPRPRRRMTVSTIAPTHSTMSAGASEGAHAITAAKSRDAAPEATHDRWATEPA